MTNQTTFVPSASVSFSPSQEAAATFSLPTVDGSKIDTTITNNSPAVVWLAFGTRAAAIGSADLQVPLGQTVLLTANTATLAAAAADPLVISYGALASGASTCSAIAAMRGPATA